MNRAQFQALLASLTAIVVALLYTEWRTNMLSAHLKSFELYRDSAGAAAKMDEFSPDDPNSFSRPDLCQVEKLHLALAVDFDKRILRGAVVLDVRKKDDGATKLVLDTRDLKIHEVTDGKAGDVLGYVLHPPRRPFGAKLEIDLPQTAGPTYSIRIKYETSPKSSALQWLRPEQTAGKVHPYLFSQCQAIHARSMLPCQDTPTVKAPFTAEIQAPEKLTVLMGALKGETIADPGDPKSKIHHFEQPVCIPSYLIALAVGALESRKIGPRSHVWSEKEFIKQAEYEFGETEKMLKTGESVMGPYVWGQYDILVMPPSFPFGGMENPGLTFVTPTLLAGDRSLTFVIAHEIAHSWTGNLVTNKNFEHFWLNEGFTVFTERKILGRMFGEPCRHFHAIIGWKELEDSIAAQGPTNPLTHLVPNLTMVDPDDAFSTVPYEKGHSFLFHIEELVGGPNEFEPFLRKYVEKFKYQSISTQDWKDFLFSYFQSRDLQDGALQNIDWNAWLHSPGMPPVNISFDTSMAAACKTLCLKWLDSDIFDLSDFSIADITNMSSMQKSDFLSQLLQKEPLPPAKLEAMDKAYNMSAVQNSEIKFRWIRLGIRARWMDIVPQALDFVTSQGRMKFVRPIFRDLYAWDEVRDKAIETYHAISTQMMYVTSAMVAKDLHLEVRHED